MKHNIKHIAIIPDGNRRWASQNNVSIDEGHRQGLLVVAPQIIKKAWELDIHTVTIWLFSTLNWKRKKDEVDNLMQLFFQIFNVFHEFAIANNVKIVHVGTKNRLPFRLVDLIQKVEKDTINNTNRQCNIAIDYNGHDEIVNSINCILKKNQKASIKISAEDITENLYSSIHKHPFPEIVLRTSGESRLSGFMNWQISHSEIFSIEKYFPDFTENDLCDVITMYNNKEQRFGQ